MGGVRIPGGLVQALKARTLIPFVGAGVSRDVLKKGDRVFPLWRELLERAAGKLGDDDAVLVRALLKKNRLLDAATEARTAMSVRLE